MSKRQSFADFKRVREEVGIDDVLKRYGVWDTLKGRGAQLRGPCPIHGGNNSRQFTVNLNKNVWHCFGDCDEGGNVIEFVAAMENCNIREAGLLLAEWFDLPVKGKAKHKRQRSSSKRAHSKSKASDDDPQRSGEESEEEEKPGYNEPLSFERLKHLDPQHEALDERGISPETAEHFGVGYCTRGIMRGRIAIPVHNPEGELVAYAGTDPGDASAPYRWPKGFRPELEVFNAHRVVETKALRRDGLIVALDFFDVFALHEEGHDNAVALFGAGLSTAQFEIVSLICERIEDIDTRRIHVALPHERFDDDPPYELLGRLACIAPVCAIPLQSLTD